MKLSKKSGTYKFPNNGFTQDNLVEYLESNGYEKKPDDSGGIQDDWKRANYIGKNCYFTFRDPYGYDIIVTNEDNECGLVFSLGFYGKITYVFKIYSNGNSKNSEKMVDAERHPDDAAELVREFFGIK